MNGSGAEGGPGEKPAGAGGKPAGNRKNNPSGQAFRRHHLLGFYTMFVLGIAVILVVSLLIGVSILFVLFTSGLVVPERGNPLPVLLLIALPSILISLVLITGFGRNAIRPLNDLSKGLNEVASGNFSVRLNEQVLGQYSETSRNFNQMAQELENIELLREDFIMNVSHEFKTPLSSIQGYATLLQDPCLEEAERAEYLEAILSATRSLSNLSSNILELSNLETQTSELPREEYSLDEQLRQVIVLLEPVCSKKELTLDIELDAADILANQDLLETVWINLLGNAIKFTEDGGSIAVRMRRLAEQGEVGKTAAGPASPPAGGVEVSIIDTGCGMEERELSRIFDKFYQADRSHKAEGNGLGLSLVSTIIAKHNGSIKVESTPGKGTRFTICLP